jgi:glycosyltransferase involved in cell wall biosynthesis
MASHLEMVLEAARELTDRKDIVFLLVGDGAERSRLVAMRDQIALRNVIILGQEPKEKMPYLWALSDASLVLLKKSKLFTTVIPSKIFESMAMKSRLSWEWRGKSLRFSRLLMLDSASIRRTAMSLLNVFWNSAGIEIWQRSSVQTDVGILRSITIVRYWHGAMNSCWHRSFFPPNPLYRRWRIETNNHYDCAVVGDR